MLGLPTDDTSGEAEHKGVAYEAKVAFYDIGTGGESSLLVTPLTLIDMFQPAYDAGTTNDSWPPIMMMMIK